MEKRVVFDFEDGVTTADILLNRSTRVAITIDYDSNYSSGTPPKISLTGSLDGENFSPQLLPLDAVKDRQLFDATDTVYWLIERPITVKTLRVTVDPGGATTGTGSVYLFFG